MWRGNTPLGEKAWLLLPQALLFPLPLCLTLTSHNGLAPTLCSWETRSLPFLFFMASPLYIVHYLISSNYSAKGNRKPSEAPKENMFEIELTFCVCEFLFVSSAWYLIKFQEWAQEKLELINFHLFSGGFFFNIHFYYFYLHSYICVNVGHSNSVFLDLGKGHWILWNWIYRRLWATRCGCWEPLQG